MSKGGKRKGMSLEDKRTALMEMLMQDETVYQLKDVEKTAYKRKGVIAQSVKEVLQSLADDGMILTEKLGQSNYFWLFPSQASNTRKRTRDTIIADIAETEKKIKTFKEEVKKKESERQDTVRHITFLTHIYQPERAQMLEQLAAKEAEHAKLVARVSELSGLDPDYLEALQQDVSTSRDACNRWTDNLFTLRSYCSSKFGIEEKKINSIPSDLDYL